LKWDFDKKGYRLFTHADTLLARDVVFKVHEKGRQRVLRERQKNVHAYLLCHDITILENLPENDFYQEIYYNPYTTDSFIIKDTGKPIYEVGEVVLSSNKCWILRDDRKVLNE
jgi:hypothetical protein